MVITLIQGDVSKMMPEGPIVFPDMALAHHYCIGSGIELGAAAQNPFHLPGAINVAPFSDDPNNIDYQDYLIYQNEQIKHCGQYVQIDLVGEAHAIPVPDQSQDYVISSHVVEHLPDLISAFLEWNRVLKPGGIVFMLFPKRDILSVDAERPITPISHFVEDFYLHRTPETHPIDPGNGIRGHYHVFSLGSMLELVHWCNVNLGLSWHVEEVEETDSKNGIGHTVVCRYIPVDGEERQLFTPPIQVHESTAATPSEATLNLEAEFVRRGPWVTRFEIGGRAYGGTFDAMNDARVSEFFAVLPEVRTILELGSLEGGHTFALAKHPGVERVLGLEARDFNIARAMFAKSVLKIENVDFVQANLEEMPLSWFGQFDAIFCSGLMYHLPRPWELPIHMAQVTRSVYLSTHYATTEQTQEQRGSYVGCFYTESGLQDPLSGMSEQSFWPTLEGLERMFHDAGFHDFRVMSKNTQHPHGALVNAVITR